MDQGIRRRLEALGINSEFKVQDCKEVLSKLDRLLIKAQEKSQELEKKIAFAEGNKKIAEKRYDKDRRQGVEQATKMAVTFAEIEGQIERLRKAKKNIDDFIKITVSDLNNLKDLEEYE